MMAPTGDDALRKALAEALPMHQSWCHAEAHADCCNADDCDCGVADSLTALLPVVLRYGREKAAEELRAAASDWPPTWAVDPATYLRDLADALVREDPT